MGYYNNGERSEIRQRHERLREAVVPCLQQVIDSSLAFGAGSTEVIGALTRIVVTLTCDRAIRKKLEDREAKAINIRAEREQLEAVEAWHKRNSFANDDD